MAHPPVADVRVDKMIAQASAMTGLGFPVPPYQWRPNCGLQLASAPQEPHGWPPSGSVTPVLPVSHARDAGGAQGDLPCALRHGSRPLPFCGDL
jgi:hypothetical protein